MFRKRMLTGIGAALGMLVLILDSKTALQAAASGIDLCIRSVIPSLFPFFMLSSLLTGSLMGTSTRWMRRVGKWLGIPEGAESIFLAGLIGGYPLGAVSISQARGDGQLSPRDSRRMMAFCSNAGPAFIFGIAGSMFSKPWISWLLWSFLIFSAVATAKLLPGRPGKPACPSRGSLNPAAALKSALYAMASVCGWVILFRILTGFLARWFLWLLPGWGQVLIVGVLELSNGCLTLGSVSNEGIRLILCAFFLAFGGLCVTMQTVSVGKEVDLRLYLPGKLFQGCLCAALSCLAQGFIPGLDRLTNWIPLFATQLCASFLLGLLLRKMQKSSSIMEPVGV